MNQAALLVSMLFRAYILLVFVWVLGSWFPQWRYQSWYRAIDGIVRPYIELFRGLPLRMGMMDLTPMAAIFALYICQMLIVSALGGGLY